MTRMDFLFLIYNPQAQYWQLWLYHFKSNINISRTLHSIHSCPHYVCHKTIIHATMLPLWRRGNTTDVTASTSGEEIISAAVTNQRFHTEAQPCWSCGVCRQASYLQHPPADSGSPGCSSPAASSRGHAGVWGVKPRCSGLPVRETLAQ